VGKNIAAPPDQRVYVKLSEIDGVDAVVIGGGKR
jgi:pyrimidine operon attenuation protein/uracil phosphoribosyltransferase